jgi:predicted lipoprotein
MEFAELQQIVESNSRAIQAILEAQATDRLRHEEAIARHEEVIARHDQLIDRLANLNEGVVNLLNRMDDDRPTVLRRLSSIENKVDRLLERSEDGI